MFPSSSIHVASCSRNIVRWAAADVDESVKGHEMSGFLFKTRILAIECKLTHVSAAVCNHSKSSMNHKRAAGKAPKVLWH
jgi:hypothetical protein